jgi:hypothetical protein
VGALLLIVTLVSAINPPPQAVNSTAKVFLGFVVPFFFVLCAVIVGIFSVKRWMTYKAGEQNITLGEQSLAFSGDDGAGTLPWATFAHFKETPSNFLLWRDSYWMVLPKRYFQSEDDVAQCRTLLEKNLKPSRWFTG